LANLDVSTIQAEREAKMKERIIGSRLKRNLSRYFHKLARILAPAGRGLTVMFKWIYRKLDEIKESAEAAEETESGSVDIAEKLFSEAEELFRQEELEKAEAKLIEIIGLDAKNSRAFKLLGKVYFERKDYNEARQTLEHVLRLLEKEYDARLVEEKEEISDETKALALNIAEIYYDLAQAHRAMESHGPALAAIKEALKYEPNNPRYLDIKLEISIINKDKINALSALEKLKKVNPENKKFKEWEKKVGEL
jgi:tetratricopeptide (TPR) repeat protein